MSPRRAVNGYTPVSPMGVDRIPGAQTALGIAAEKVISTSAVRLARVSVIVAGTAPGSAHDCAATGDAAAGNQVFVIQNAVGVYEVDWPCLVGLVVKPGAGQTIAVAWF